MLGEMQNGPTEKVHPVNVALKRALLSLQGKNDVQKLPGDGLAQQGIAGAVGEMRIPVFLLDLA